MTSLITGGTGFTGAQVARILLNKGEKPVVFDINPSIKRLYDLKDDIEIVKGDLGNLNQITDVIKRIKPRVIYHLGGMLSVPSEQDPAGALQANVLGTFYLLEAAKQYGVEQVLFSSSIATYGFDIKDDSINDYTLQRPQLFYGATKVFCEHMGSFFKRKHQLDFRTVRYPVVVGPGVKIPGVAQFASWMIEECAKGKTYTLNVGPETKLPIIYFKDAARAIVMLGEAPVENIKTTNYVLAGIQPLVTVAELLDILKTKIPGADVNFDVNTQLQNVLDQVLPIDDSNAKKEWGWSPDYDLEHTIDDFLRELEVNRSQYM